MLRRINSRHPWTLSEVITFPAKPGNPPHAAPIADLITKSLFIRTEDPENICRYSLRHSTNFSYLFLGGGLNGGDTAEMF